jgi:hypothetical protein
MACCTISRSGKASATARIYLRLREDRPFISGNAILEIGKELYIVVRIVAARWYYHALS